MKVLWKTVSHQRPAELRRSSGRWFPVAHRELDLPPPEKTFPRGKETAGHWCPVSEVHCI